MLSIILTFEVSILLKSTESKFWHSENIDFILVTDDVSNLLKFNDDKAVHL